MKTILIVLFYFAFFSFNLLPQESLSYKDESLVSVLNDIEKKSGIKFIYKDELIRDKKITLTIKKDNIEKILKDILNNSDISYKIFNEKSIVLFKDDKEFKDKNYTPVVINDDFIIKDSSVTIIKPVLLTKELPAYPREAIEKNIEGKVALKFLIDKEGNVILPRLETTSGSPILDSAAINYVEQLKYIPANANGEPKNIWMHMKFNYYFENQEE